MNRAFLEAKLEDARKDREVYHADFLRLDGIVRFLEMVLSDESAWEQEEPDERPAES